jgi:hypothetical protein
VVVRWWCGGAAVVVVVVWWWCGGGGGGGFYITFIENVLQSNPFAHFTRQSISLYPSF